MSRNVTFAADDHLERVLELDLSDEEEKKISDMDTEVPEATVTFEFDESMRGQMDSANGRSFIYFLKIQFTICHKTTIVFTCGPTHQMLCKYTCTLA